MTKKLTPPHHREPTSSPEGAEKQPLTEGLNMEELMEKAKQMTPEQIRQKVARLNQRIKLVGQSHEVEVAVDPSINTWAATRIPKKRVMNDGTAEDTNHFHYIIVLPYPHLAIDDESFLLGELRHELGHVLYTDWRLMKDLADWVEKQGYPKDAIHKLLNATEDPRMEHVSIYPAHLEGYVRKWFWSKNKQLILPNIGNGLAKGHPVDQFDFLIKLYSLWQHHAEQAEAENILPWDDLDQLHPRVQEEWAKVKDTVEQLMGIGPHTRPEMRSSKLKQAMKEVLWPSKKVLIDEFGAGGESGEGKGEGGGPGEEGGDPFQDPDVIDNLPPEVQKLLNQKMEQYKKQIEGEQQQQIDKQKAAGEANKEIDKKQHERMKRKDGIEKREIRQKYNQLKKEAKVVANQMARLFEKYFPKIAYPKDVYGVKGKKYNAREHLKRYASGMEKPLASPNVPEKSGFILQLIIDVSGSMYDGRIDEVVKTAIGILEATEDYPIYIEILASDDKHGGIDKKYILKAFDEEFGGVPGGKLKERLINCLTDFGGGNDDAASLQWAIPRIEKKRKQLKSDYEKIAALTIFLSDAQIDGQQDPEVVNALRKKIPILGGCIEPDPSIKNSVQAAYGPIGEGSFCPDSLAQFPRELEKVLRKKISKMFRK